MLITFEALRDEYARLWTSMEIRASKAASVEVWARKVIDYKAGRYGAVEKAIGVPWFVVGILHLMEAGLNGKGEPRFDRHLHNGDPLAAKTVQVPRGRPPGNPPWTWAQSATDALTMHGLEKIKEWSIERICYEVERYNGWGYRQYHASTLSPYLWSFTNHYASGKYVADGQWSSSAVSGQCGAMAILKKCMELDADVRAAIERHAPEASDEPLPVEDVVADPALSFPKAENKPVPIVATAYGSRTIWAQLMAAASVVCGVATDWAKQAWEWVLWAAGIVPAVYSEAKEGLTSAQEMAGWFGVNWKAISLSIALVCVFVALWRHLNDKRKLVEAQS